MLLDIHPRQNLQQDLLGGESINFSAKRVLTCDVMDAINMHNNRVGRHTIWLTAQGHSNGRWQMRQQYRRPRFTTCWDDLIRLQCSCLIAKVMMKLDYSDMRECNNRVVLNMCCKISLNDSLPIKNRKGHPHCPKKSESRDTLDDLDPDTARRYPSGAP